MSHGPLDFVVVRFPGTSFSPEIAASLHSLVTSGTIRVIDLLFLTKDDDGSVTVEELADLNDGDYLDWEPVVSDISGYLTDDDALMLADSIPANSSAALVLIENTWATTMVQAIADANGEVLISDRLPRTVVDQMELLHTTAN